MRDRLGFGVAGGAGRPPPVLLVGVPWATNSRWPASRCAASSASSLAAPPCGGLGPVDAEDDEPVDCLARRWGSSTSIRSALLARRRPGRGATGCVRRTGACRSASGCLHLVRAPVSTASSSGTCRPHCPEPFHVPRALLAQPDDAEPVRERAGDGWLAPRQARAATCGKAGGAVCGRVVGVVALTSQDARPGRNWAVSARHARSAALASSSRPSSGLPVPRPPAGVRRR